MKISCLNINTKLRRLRIIARQIKFIEKSTKHHEIQTESRSAIFQECVLLGNVFFRFMVGKHGAMFHLIVVALIVGASTFVLGDAFSAGHEGALRTRASVRVWFGAGLSRVRVCACGHTR